MNVCSPFRFAHHIELPEIGEAGQSKLLASKVLLVGMGGLGAPSSLYLTASGIGYLTLVDDDVVQISNLQRQIIYKMADQGQLKVQASRDRLLALNDKCQITAVSERLTVANADTLISSHDVIVDGSDNFDTRYLLNEFCYKHKKPLISGAVLGFDGQVSVFKSYISQHPCYKCLYPSKPERSDVPSCTESAVFSPVPGIVALSCVTEVVKEILNIGQSLSGTLLTYNALSQDFKKIRFPKRLDCTVCGDIK